MKLSRSFAQRFCDTLAQSDQALFAILKDHPEFPSWKQLIRWRERQPWFAVMWRRAREEQGEHLAQKCLDLARETTPKNAHQKRVQYDIYKWVASRFAPAIYGDRPVAPQTNVAVGITISTERLNEIRSKLNVTREALTENTHSNGDTPRKREGLSNTPRISEGSPLTITSRK